MLKDNPKPQDFSLCEDRRERLNNMYAKSTSTFV